MKKLLLLFCVFVIATLSASAQSYEDVIYLKNGTIIHGVIIEQVPNEKYKIQTYDGNIFVFEVENIEKITKEISRTGKMVQATNHFFSHAEKGFLLYLGLDVSPFFPDSSCSLDIMTGYRFSNYFALAAGSSLGYSWEFNRFAGSYYIHLRSDFLKTKVRPFVSVNLGYQDGVYYKPPYYFSGLLVLPTLGASFPAGNGRIVAGIHYRIISHSPWGADAGNLGLRVGYEF